MRPPMGFRANQSGASVPRPALSARLRRSMSAWALSLVLAAAASAHGFAAPITGETQPDPSGAPAEAPPLPALQDPAAQAPTQPAFDGSPDATVLEFSIVPSASDPNKMETVIIVQQQGGKNICVNQSTGDIISRGYRRRGNEPFDPPVPSELRGLTSGDSGELVGFNDIKVFIRPHSSADEFTNTDECFQVSDVEACFVPDAEDCDQLLHQGDFICVGDSISNSGCPVVDHANLMRQLRILMALNAPPGETPIITAADLGRAPELAPQNGEGAPGGLPAGAGPAGPTAGAPFSGSGGGVDLIPVPNVVGMTLQQASAAITAVGLTVGNVTTEGEAAGLSIPSIISPARAQAPQSVVSQTPPAGTLVPALTPVSLVLSAAAADIPEPSSLALFVMGLGLLVLVTRWQRRRHG